MSGDDPTGTEPAGDDPRPTAAGVPATWEPRPLPEPDEETGRFWAAAADGELLLGRCNACDLTFYYPRSHCPDCMSDDVDWVPAAGTGTVYSYTRTAIVDGWPDEALPLVCGYIELEEGPRLFATLFDCELSEVEVGMPVEVRFVATEDPDVAIPVFVPAADREGRDRA